MTDARARRDEIADAVRQGYAEVMVSAGVWKGRPTRPWAEGVVRTGLTGEALEAWVDAMALKHPGQVH